jgi:proteic killer suppression protein
MIGSFRSRSLKAFWIKGDSSKLQHDLVERLRRRLDSLDNSKRPEDMNVPGFDFHKLRGTPIGHAMHQPTHPGAILREDVLLRLQQARDLWRAERDLASEIAAIPTLRAV